MPDLERMTLKELHGLIFDLEVLAQAGEALQKCGLKPTFSLPPGQPAQIDTGHVVISRAKPQFPFPPAPDPFPPTLADQLVGLAMQSPPPADGPRAPGIDAPPADLGTAGGAASEATPSPESATRCLHSVPGVDAPSAVVPHAAEGAASEVTQSPEAEAPSLPTPGVDASAAADEGAAAECADIPADPDRPPATMAGEGERDASGGGGSAEAAAPAAAPARGAAWTEAEDQQLIDIVVRMTQDQGTTKTAALQHAADMLGRPLNATHFRAYNQLAKRLQAAIDARRGAPALPPLRDALPTLAEAAKAAAEKAAAPGAGFDDPLLAHLIGLPTKGWTAQQDLDLINLACLGWKMPEIALELGRNARDLQARFDLLTGLRRDDNDRPQRRWTRDAVQAALQQICAPSSAA